MKLCRTILATILLLLIMPFHAFSNEIKDKTQKEQLGIVEIDNFKIDITAANETHLFPNIFMRSTFSPSKYDYLLAAYNASRYHEQAEEKEDKEHFLKREIEFYEIWNELKGLQDKEVVPTSYTEEAIRVIEQTVKDDPNNKYVEEMKNIMNNRSN
jgi:hypothetical protein